MRGAATLDKVELPTTKLGRRLAFGARAIPYVAAIVVTVAAAGAMLRGSERNDEAEVWGNAAMLVGGLLLILGLGWATAGVGAIILGIGFLISLGSYSALEDVVRYSFWGSSDTYWTRARQPVPILIQQSVDLPAPYDGYFKEDLARFAELTSAPVISDPQPGDRKLMVQSAAIAELGTAGVDIKVTHMVLNPRGGFHMPTTLSNQKRHVPGTDIIVVELGAPDPMGTKEVEIEVSPRGPRSGFEHSTTKRFDNP